MRSCSQAQGDVFHKRQLLLVGWVGGRFKQPFNKPLSNCFVLSGSVAKNCHRVCYTHYTHYMHAHAHQFVLCVCVWSACVRVCSACSPCNERSACSACMYACSACRRCVCGVHVCVEFVHVDMRACSACERVCVRGVRACSVRV